MPTLNLQPLDSLASHLINREPGTVVLPIVGAGASLSAGIPTFGALKQQIYRDFVRGLPELAAVLKAEEVDTNILDLPPFEFLSVLSRLAYGRKVIHEAIRHMTRHATHRPLAYELLAHLAKHRFVDHFISVNFDELLDEALHDEVPDRLSRIASTDDVPGPDATRGRDTCYLFKPFGTVARDGFKLEPKDIQEYGTHSMWVFILETLFHRTIRVQSAVLVLIGYAAREPAFIRLIDELTKRVGSLAVYTINPAAHAADDLQECGIDPKAIFHIRMEADTALELLLHILEMKHGDKHPKASWVPVARHRIISHLPHHHVADPMKRFTIEVILQALKSRGFFTIEAIAEISRIRRYSQGAFNALSDMRERRILQYYDSDSAAQGPATSFPGLLQNYALNRTEATRYIREAFAEFARQPQLIKWTVRRKGASFRAVRSDVSARVFIEEQFTCISHAPDIEVAAEASPSTAWMFSDRSRRLKSVADLIETTTRILTEALAEADGDLTLHGVWTTGEWLFHETGWAWNEFGLPLIDRLHKGQVDLNLVLADNPLGHTERQVRGHEVRRLLGASPKCNIYPVSWWQQNRVLTLISWTSRDGSPKKVGIYMRRRLATPIVAPVLVRGDDCGLLQDVFTRYKQKSARRQSDPLAPTSSDAAASSPTE